VTGGAAGVALREMTRGDIADGLRLSSLAGWNQRELDWRFLLERNPGRFVVALRDGRVAGTGGAVCYGTDLAWVCMILVHPDERRHGIGSTVVQGVLDRIEDVRVVGLDATPYGRGVYERLGFVETGRLVRMEAPATTGEASDSPVRAMSPSDLEAVLALDREVFGADRGDLLRWAARQAPALCAEEDGAIAGYCFGRQGARSRQIGPVVARHDRIASALVVASLIDRSGGPVVVDASADRPEWPALLADLGFVEQRPLIRMFRGTGRAGRPEMQRAIFGPEFG